MSAALFSAALSGDLEALRTALADPSAVSATEPESGDTALHVAARAGHLDGVDVLLKAGAAVDAKNGLGWTALFCAAYNHESDCGYPAIIQRLIDAGADVNARIAFGLTPLMLAAGGGEAAVCKALLDAGAEVKAVNDSGRTALMMVKERHFIDVINLLYEAEGYVPETEGTCSSTGKRAPGDAQVVQFIKRPSL
ncbi:MAG: ankyrin repeat domain-containing protein [Betaproteobacteria bacterium]|nr:ankyrin repeat domain-containing protein [Betaproteobacteria bacterium]